MSGPMSTLVLGEVSKATVERRVVRDAVLPAAPDHRRPGSGEDPLGVRMTFLRCSQLSISALGPSVAPPGVAGEVAECVAQLLVGAPSERGCVHPARTPRRGHDAAHYIGPGRSGDDRDLHSRRRGLRHDQALR